MLVYYNEFELNVRIMARLLSSSWRIVETRIKNMLGGGRGRICK
jgi:hypothetical protein